MEGNEILGSIREAVHDAKKGVHQVTIESLEGLLSILEKGQVTGRKPSEVDLASTLAEYNATYLTGIFQQLEWLNIGKGIHYLTIILVIAAYVVFGFGGYELMSRSVRMPRKIRVASQPSSSGIREFIMIKSGFSAIAL